MACIYCEVPVYIKVTKYAKSMLAPATRIEAIRQKLEDLTGETYVAIAKRYCPMCGAELKDGAV